MSQPRRQQLTISGAVGPIAVSLFHPEAAGPFPGVVLLHEGSGVTQQLLGLGRRLAELGYLTLIPDLYSHDGLRRQLAERDVLRYLPIARDPRSESLLDALPIAERAAARQVLEWFRQRDRSSYFSDAQAAVAALKLHKRVRPNAIASIGFSLGGGLSAQLAAAGTELAAGVIFYGRTPEPAALARLRYPLLGHYAERDPVITSGVAELERRLSPTFRAFIYPGTEHGFFNEERATYQRESSALAYQRTLAFLAERLGPRVSAV